MITTPPITPNAPISEFLSPENELRCTREDDKELGSLALYNPLGGLRQAVWRCFLSDQWVSLQRLPDGAITKEIAISALATDLSLAFDSNMRPYFAWVEGLATKLYWYNTQSEQNEIFQIANAFSPRLCLDDKRPRQSANRDVILCYLRDGALYARQQRDRFETEIFMMETDATELGQIGMSKGNRLQIELLFTSCE